jgi:hypothetical protein
MIEPGSEIDNILLRIADVMRRANTSVDAEVNLIRNVADHPRPGMRLLAKALRDLAGDAGYQAERLETLLAEHDASASARAMRQR